ncbi:TAP42-like TOR regulation protein [Chloropicon primus]|uniref:TAP42-like TOR regulation protein n=1 Tax=Chloropicon primus TaxID=1764295 RepID=A0A5B8MBS0_9CHLO|nr:TAP42-like TOR regulation protein [Chloropicon primus]UPQ96734.1 TAP42-like TOR regulation protein [Chloropicon primus]|eukprot:QDZ17514.1 TAP42-like TOR regulation protein [Chloropicon primus]
MVGEGGGEGEGGTLKERFGLCVEACEGLEGGGKQGKTTTKELVKELKACEAMVQALALFSDNEDKDDITTGSIKYLLIPYYLGVAYTNVEADRPVDERLVCLRQGLASFLAFARQCKDKGLLEDKVKSLVEGMDGAAAITFGREEKIALYRRQKELRQAMETLSLVAEAEDEDTTRALSLLQVNSSAMSAYQQYASLQKEVEILEFTKRRQEELAAGGSGREVEVNRGRERPRVNGDDGRIKGMFTIQPGQLSQQAARERFAQGVFKQSHLPYTMTVEEFGEQELQRMREREEARARDAQQDRGSGQKCCSDDDHSEDEECIKKAREWDEFKDDNPFGWGNKNLRPCA